MRALPTEAERRWVSGFSAHKESVSVAGAKVEEQSDETPPRRGKNCDKQLNFIVRVMRSLFILVYGYS